MQITKHYRSIAGALTLVIGMASPIKHPRIIVDGDCLNMIQYINNSNN